MNELSWEVIMKHLITYCFLFSTFFLNGMQQSVQCKKDEKEAIELAKISLNHFGRSPRNAELLCDLLYNAAKYQRHDLANFVLERVYQIHGRQDLMPIIGRGFFAAVASGNLHYLKKIIEFVPIKFRSQALQVAARNGNIDVAQFLLDNAADPESTGKNGKTPLAIAIEHDREAVVKLLLEKRSQPDKSFRQWANPNGAAPHQFYDLTTWTTTLKHGLKYLRLLLEHGANPNGVQGSARATPVMICATKNYHQALAVLLEFDAAINIQVPRSKNTPLIQAARHAHWESVQVLAAGSTNPLIRKACELASGWTDTYLARLPLELRREIIAPMRSVSLNVTATDKSGRDALTIARTLEKTAIREKKIRFGKIIATLDAHTPKALTQSAE